MADSRSFEIVGAPFDGASTLGIPGSRYAPDSIRRALEWITMRVEDGAVYSLETGELHDAPHIADGGDAHVVAHDLEATLANTSSRIAQSVRAGHVPLLLGGDDCFLYAGTRGLHDGTDEGTVAVIHFDAHLDVMDENEQQGRHSQSSGMRRSLELQRASRDHSVQVGLRHFNFPSSRAYVLDDGPAQITARTVDQIGSTGVVDRVLERIAGADHVHLSFDIDAIDPAHAPGAGASEPGGITSRQAIDIVSALAPHCDSFAVTEVNPMTDHRDMTSTLAAYLCYYFSVFGQHAARA
ncbi:arginase family protein [Paramicrobacterium chengjingii]|uniref:Arginase family protein n=1 Tax=Paramicrobacterium chengjingii TaxID=2769067 RepID=A0ABX6YKK5_9MICO|nr:arginase family protein [Microbacterium chengjingii]QPZ39322.1 arginase family protein [Microbacterium chengjingii]